MILLRRFFFGVFVAAYLVLCPLTILYALGYLVRPGMERGIVKTGLVYLATTPSGATVYLGQKRYTGTTPAVLRGLLPGEYSVRLVLKHYRPWAGMVRVVAERATVLDRVLLLPESRSPEVVVAEPSDEIVSLGEGEALLLVRGSRLEDVACYHRVEGGSQPLPLPDASWREARVMSWTLVPGSDAAIARARDTSGSIRYLRIRLRGRQLQADDLSSFFVGRRPDRIAWDLDDADRLFILQDGVLDRVDLMAKAIYPRMAERVLGYGCADGAVYVLTDDYLIRRFDRDGTEKARYFLDQPLQVLLAGRSDGWRIVRVSDDLFLLWGESGELFVTRPPYRLADAGIEGVEPDVKRERVAFWRGEEVGVLDVVASGRHAERDDADTDMTVRWWPDAGESIEQLAWVYDGSHILLRQRDRVALMALVGPEQPEWRELLRVRRGSRVEYVEASGLVYYLDERLGRLCAWPLVVRSEASIAPLLRWPEEVVERARGREL